MMNLKGFTLLEVLIAISISALIGIASVQLLSNAGDAAKVSEEKSAQMAALLRFNQLAGRDMQQFINRPIRDEYGDPKPGLLLDNGDYPLELTRAGWRNSPITEDPRATLQRVAYRTEEIDSEACEPARARLAEAQGLEPEDYEADHECLVRYYWTVLDRIAETEPRQQIVLDRIESLRFELITCVETDLGLEPTLQTQDTWPPLSPNQGEVPVAIRWVMTLPQIGDIERVWLMAHDGGTL